MIKAYPLLYISKLYLGNTYKDILDERLEYPYPEKPTNELTDIDSQHPKDTPNYIVYFFYVFCVISFLSPYRPYVMMPIALILGLINYRLHRNFNRTEERTIKYKKSIIENEYQIKLSRYKEIVKLREIAEEYLHLPEYEFRRVILQAFRDLEPIKLIETQHNKPGYSENKFYKELKNMFDENILRNMHFDYYTPDFIYIDSNFGIYVDIEIDEPYVLNTGKEIHVEGEDDERNNHFLLYDWSIIRFSEKQIVEQPEECLLEISIFVDYLKHKHMMIRNKKLKRDYTWDKDTATKYSESRYREDYLGINPVNRKNYLEPNDEDDINSGLPF